MTKKTINTDLLGRTVRFGNVPRYSSQQHPLGIMPGDAGTIRNVYLEEGKACYDIEVVNTTGNVNFGSKNGVEDGVTNTVFELVPLDGEGPAFKSDHCAFRAKDVARWANDGVGGITVWFKSNTEDPIIASQKSGVAGAVHDFLMKHGPGGSTG